MSIRHRINHAILYKSDTLSDIQFVLNNRNGQQVKIPAHRQILISQSPVFERMFCGMLKEGPSVAIADACAEAFAEFLQLFYLAEFSLSTANIAEVFKLIDKYDVTAAWPACEEFLRETLSADLAFLYYELALSFDLSQAIVKQVEAFICQDPERVLRSCNGRSSNRLVLNAILQLDQLTGDESELLDGVMAWTGISLVRQGDNTVAVADIRHQLGDSLDLIRYPVMREDELIACTERYPNILSTDELNDILLFIADGRPLTVAKRFCARRRRATDIHVAFVPSQACANRTILTNDTVIHFKLTANAAQTYLISIGMVAVRNLHCDIMLYGNDKILYKEVHFLNESHVAANSNLTVCTLNAPVTLSTADCSYILRISFRRAHIEVEANMITQPEEENDMITFAHANPSFVTGLSFVRV